MQTEAIKLKGFNLKKNCNYKKGSLLIIEIKS